MIVEDNTVQNSYDIFVLILQTITQMKTIMLEKRACQSNRWLNSTDKTCNIMKT